MARHLTFTCDRCPTEAPAAPIEQLPAGWYVLELVGAGFADRHGWTLCPRCSDEVHRAVVGRVEPPAPATPIEFAERPTPETASTSEDGHELVADYHRPAESAPLALVPPLLDPEARLTAVGLTMDEANWYGLVHSPGKTALRDLEPAAQERALAWLESDEGVTTVRSAVDDVRRRLRAAFFVHWGQIYPTPRKKDGATDEQIARATEASEADRRRVMAAWYGSESMKTVSIRAALKSAHRLGWLKETTPAAFEAEVSAALADSAATA